MKNRFLFLLLIGSIVSSVMLSSCKKDNDNSSDEDDPQSENSGTFTDSRDGKTYKWVKIGDQVWMAENLAYTGSDIQHITNNDDWKNNTDYDGWCYYDNNQDNGNTYGVLYQWEAAKTACPAGWHLPTGDEWRQLQSYLMENGYSYDGVIGNDGIAKSLATNSGWAISNNQGAVGNSDYPEYQNKTGFSALPGGLRHGVSGAFDRLREHSSWWSNSGGYGGSISFFGLSYEFAMPVNGGYPKSFGLSVRCVKD